MSAPAPDWNARWAAGDGASGARLYGAEANAYLRAAIGVLGAPRSALLLADGDGRNSQYLAGLGVAATAVDLSEVATEQARAFDRKAGVEVERVAADLALWTPPEDRRWGAAIVLYLHTAPEIRARALGIAAAALAPGGWLLVEGFSTAQAERAGLGPDDPSKLYTLDALRRAASGLTILEALEGEALLDEGPKHQGLARVARLLARKPS